MVSRLPAWSLAVLAAVLPPAWAVVPLAAVWAVELSRNGKRGIPVAAGLTVAAVLGNLAIYAM